MLRDLEYPSETFFDIPPTAVSSPTLSISTVSDLTPTELSEDIEDDNEMVIHHDTFYFEDGDVEIVCRHALPGSLDYGLIFFSQTSRYPFPVGTPPRSNARRATSDYLY